MPPPTPLPVQLSRDSPTRFLPMIFSHPKPLTRYWKTFQIWLRIRWDVRDFWLTLRYFYSRESILPILFTTESCASPHRYSGESLFVRIMCINSRLSFKAESRYFPYCLLQRVTTPRLIYSAGVTVDSRVIFENNEGLPLPLKGRWRKKWNIHGEHCSSRTFYESKIWIV